MYCPGPKAVLKLIENENSVSDIPQAVLDQKLVTLSAVQIAESCQTSIETVTAFFAGIRDEVVDLVLNKN